MATKTKILVVGNGWLGNIIKDYLGADITEKRIEEIVANDDILTNYDVVINTAGKTNIDWCEKNKEACYEANAKAALDLSLRCEVHGIKYVFISSACILQSADILDVKYEDSLPDPQCYYASTKWYAEAYLAESQALILRIRLPVSFQKHPRNSLVKILSYPKLIDTQESMTVIEDFLPIMRDLINSQVSGVFNIVNSGTISPHEIANIFGHPHQILEKWYFDKEMLAQGRAKRVSTIVGSKKLPLMPNIRERIAAIKEIWQ